MTEQGPPTGRHGAVDTDAARRLRAALGTTATRVPPPADEPAPAVVAPPSHTDGRPPAAADLTHLPPPPTGWTGQTAPPSFVPPAPRAAPPPAPGPVPPTPSLPAMAPANPLSRPTPPGVPPMATPAPPPASPPAPRLVPAGAAPGTGGRGPAVAVVGIASAVVLALLVGMAAWGMSNKSSAEQWRERAQADRARLEKQVDVALAIQADLDETKQKVADLAADKANLTDREQIYQEVLGMVDAVSASVQACAAGDGAACAAARSETERLQQIVDSIGA